MHTRPHPTEAHRVIGEMHSARGSFSVADHRDHRVASLPAHSDAGAERAGDLHCAAQTRASEVVAECLRRGTLSFADGRTQTWTGASHSGSCP